MPKGKKVSILVHFLFWLQCPNGHTICQSCKAQVKNICPICRQELGNIRCLALEKVAESLELPCKYKFLGCEGIFSYHSRLRHEQSCRYILTDPSLTGSGDCQFVIIMPVAHFRMLLSDIAHIIALMLELNVLLLVISCSLLSISRMTTMLTCMTEAPLITAMSKLILTRWRMLHGCWL